MTEYFTNSLQVQGLLRFRIELIDRTLSIWTPPQRPMVFRDVSREDLRECFQQFVDGLTTIN
jgi:hypothetical protein